VTRDRARKKSVRAQMAADGEPYSVAARKLGRTGAADEAARDEVITRVEATLAAASARYEVRKQMTADPATAPARDRHRDGPFKRLTGTAVKAGWDHLVPEQARTRLRTASSGIAMGIIEPSARRFQPHRVTQDYGMPGMLMSLRPSEVDPAPEAYSALGVDPLELLLHLRPVITARYAGEKTIREARCRKIAITVTGTTAVLTVWADGQHVRQIQAVTAKKTERSVVTVLVTTTVTAQLWDFGVPVDSMDWPPLPPPTGRALPLIRRQVQIHPSPRPGQAIPGAGQR
jgi:hypothetical protein